MGRASCPRRAYTIWAHLEVELREAAALRMADVGVCSAHT